MGIHGHVSLYTTKFPAISRDEAVRALARVLGAKAIRRYTEFWIDDNEGYPDNFPDEKSEGPLSFDDFAARTLTRSTVQVYYDYESWRQVESALMADPIAAISGGFVPNSLGLVWGPWVVYGDTDEGPEHVATSMVCLEFFGWSCPTDWEEYRRRFLKVPLIAALYEDVQAIFGPLRMYAGWHL
jgi:hypothetical protein